MVAVLQQQDQRPVLYISKEAGEYLGSLPLPASRVPSSGVVAWLLTLCRSLL